MKPYLHNAIFYPCSGLDGFSFRLANLIKPELNIKNHILVDFSISEIDFLDQCYNILGYKIKKSTKLNQQDLSPKGWKPEMPPMLDIQRYNQAIQECQANKNLFAYLIEFKRETEFSTEHGPEEMNVIFIKGEAIATYQALFQNWEFNPRFILFKSAGWGWGMGYEDFRDAGNSLEWIIGANPFSKDSILLSEVELLWQSIELKEEIENSNYGSQNLGKLYFYSILKSIKISNV
jgi:hypothetical protein